MESKTYTVELGHYELLTIILALEIMENQTGLQISPFKDLIGKLREVEK